MQAANEYKNGETACESVIRGLMLQLFALLLRAGTEDTLSNAKKESAHYKLIEPALRHIRDNYAGSIDIDGLALMCGLSKHYFCHIFKAVTGQSAMVYLNDYRIKVANTLLMHTEKSVADIAEECGFEGTNYFCRRYKNFYGISPGKRRSKR
jgi:two-component system response regulator YesN